jgi:putative toxin-antitoxin system antitoxin component (TIGR02293 family)
MARASSESDRALSILGGRKVLSTVRKPRQSASRRSKRPTAARTEAVYPLEPGEVRWVELIRTGLPSQSLERTAAALELSISDLSRRLRLPPRTVHRRVQKRERLTQEESERSVRVARALARAQQLLGGEDGRRWLLEPSRALGGEVPLALLDTADGFSAVMDELGRLAHGVIS